jgi:hypothetical protein
MQNESARVSRRGLLRGVAAIVAASVPEAAAAAMNDLPTGTTDDPDATLIKLVTSGLSPRRKSQDSLQRQKSSRLIT